MNKVGKLNPSRGNLHESSVMYHQDASILSKISDFGNWEMLDY